MIFHRIVLDLYAYDLNKNAEKAGVISFLSQILFQKAVRGSHAPKSSLLLLSHHSKFRIMDQYKSLWIKIQNLYWITYTIYASMPMKRSQIAHLDHASMPMNQSQSDSANFILSSVVVLIPSLDSVADCALLSLRTRSRLAFDSLVVHRSANGRWQLSADQRYLCRCLSLAP